MPREISAGKRPLQVVAAAGAVEVHQLAAEKEPFAQSALHRFRLYLLERDAATGDHRHLEALVPGDGNRAAG